MGELAWQLGGREAYDLIAEDDRAGTNPGEALRTLIVRYSPSLILIDEWVAYARLGSSLTRNSRRGPSRPSSLPSP